MTANRVKMKPIILNSFSPNMLSQFPASVYFEEMPLDEVRKLYADAESRNKNPEPLPSAVGHADTAAVFSSELSMTVPANRLNVSLTKGDRAIIGQYRGPRLPEGTTTLPEGATIMWLQVEVS